MLSNYQQFKALHGADELIILPNVWDAGSAILLQESGFPAIGTSSAAVAASLGYDDGERMPFAEYLFVIKRILASVPIPVTVDLEMGYGKTNDEIIENIGRIIELGVVGINIEDSTIYHSIRSLKSADEFTKTLEAIKNHFTQSNQSLFINVRCDTYLLQVENKQEETVNRLKLYESTGVDGVFLPCICNEEDIRDAVAATKLPLNVMCVPGLPAFDKLYELGVKRVSTGPFLFHKTYGKASELVEEIIANNHFYSIL